MTETKAHRWPPAPHTHKRERERNKPRKITTNIVHLLKRTLGSSTQKRANTEVWGRVVNPPIFTALNGALCNFSYLFHLFWRLEPRALTEHLVPSLILPTGTSRGKGNQLWPLATRVPSLGDTRGSDGLTPAHAEHTMKVDFQRQFLPPGQQARRRGYLCVKAEVFFPLRADLPR